MVKSKTWEAFIADTMLYAKGFLIMLTFILNHCLAFCYIFVMSATTLQWARECQAFDPTTVRDYPDGREHLTILAGGISGFVVFPLYSSKSMFIRPFIDVLH